MTFTKKSIPESTRREVAERYGCPPGGELHGVKCHWCDATGSIFWHQLADGRPAKWVSFSLELDHVRAESLGGTSDSQNIVLACRPCNRSKGHKSLSEWHVTDSRQAHDRLTEPVRETVSGKGREGNKEGKGRRVETSHHGVRLGDVVRPANAMMTELDTIEHLDFALELPCEHSFHERGLWGHSGPADFIVAVQCPACGPKGLLQLCASGYAGASEIHCHACRYLGLRHEFWRIVQVLR